MDPAVLEEENHAAPAEKLRRPAPSESADMSKSSQSLPELRPLPV